MDLKVTSIISGIYLSGMLLCVGYLYVVPSAFDYWGAAAKAYLDGDYLAASDYYRKIVELRPGHFGSHLYRGYSLGAQGDYEGALASFDAALAAKPHDPLALGDKARVLLRLSRFQEVAEVSSQFSKRDSSYFAVRYGLAVQLMASGDLDGADRVLREGIAADTSWAVGHFTLGCVLNRSGRPCQAVMAYGRAVVLDPSLKDHDYESVKLVTPSLPWERKEDRRRVAQACREE